MTELPNAPVIRIVKNAGAERISKEAEEKIVEAVEAYTVKLAKASVEYAGHADRKTIKPDDVELAEKYL